MINVYWHETGAAAWQWHIVFLELALYLRDTYNANIIHGKESLFIEKYNYHSRDCEFLIEDTDRDILRGISFSEGPTAFMDIFTNRHNTNDILLYTQFYNTFPRGRTADSFVFKIKPTVFYPYWPTTNYDYWYYYRKFRMNTELVDKMFCLTSTYRDDVPRLREMGLLGESPGSLTIENYLTEAIRYKVGFSTAGSSEICHREIEYMAIGLPNLRMEYMTQLGPPLIPNYHYISIDRTEFEWDANKDRIGGSKYLAAYKERFLEVKDDYEFLEFISNNGREYYEKYCSPHNRLKHLLSSLEL